MAKKQLKGSVVSNKMPKTVVIEVELVKENKKYRRRYRMQKRYKADAQEQYNIGDVVLIQECRPISKDKTWKVIKRISESVLPADQEISDEAIVEEEEKKS